MYLLCSIILIAIIVLLCLLVRKTKLDIKDRVLHIRYVIATIIFSVAGVLLFAKILSLINTIISVPLIRKLLFSIVPQTNVSAGFYWIITLICCVIIMAAYWLLMMLLRALWLKPLSKKGGYLNSSSPIEKFFNAIAGLFYEISGGCANLPPSKANFGRWVRDMRRVFALILLTEAILFCVYLQFDWDFLGSELVSLIAKSLYMIPVLSYAVLEQIELFLSADETKKDLLLETEEIGLLQKGDFSSLVDLYNRLFGGKSLISYYTGNGKGAVHRELFSGVQTEQKERVESPQLLESLCRSIAHVTTPSAQYINGLVDLINGQNIAVFDTPWGEFDAYYIAYIQHRLILSDTVLIVCDDEIQVKRMKARFTTIFRKLNAVCPLWRIRTVDTMADGETDVFICTEEQFFLNPINEKYPRFNSRLKVVVVLDSYGLMCREPAYASRLFDNFINRDIQFVFYMPENNTDICNVLQEKIGGTSVLLCENAYSNENTNVLFWRAESVYKPQLAISERLYHDFGVAYTISIIAANAGVPSVNVLASGSVPLNTYYDLVTREYTRVLTEDYLKNDAINLSTIIHNNNYSVSDPSALSFTVVYDENNNLIDVAKVWLSYGGTESSMLHIVSAPYMLRDYFACNMDALYTEASGLQLIVPQNSLRLRSPAMALLLRMRRGVSCEEIMGFAKKHNIEETDVEQILQTVLDIVFGGNNYYKVYNCFTFTECDKPEFTDSFKYTVNVTLIDESLYYRVCKMTEEFVRLDGDYTGIFPVDKADVYNYFLPKQCVTFHNVRYIINDICDGVVYLKLEETVNMECYYTPVYNITGFKKVETITGQDVSNGKFKTEFFEAQITREITSYYAHPGMLNIAQGDADTLVEFSHPVCETKTVPCMKLSIECPLDDCSEKVANTLCFLLRGAMETFMPENYRDLLIFSKINKKTVCENVRFNSPTGLLEDPIPSDLLTGNINFESIDPAICHLIPEVLGDEAEANSDSEIHIYIAQFSEIEFGSLTAIAEDLERILTTVFKYIGWAEKQDESVPLYLRFGYDSTPGIFDMAATEYCLSSIIVQSRNSDKNLAGNLHIADGSGGKYCSFCGKPVMVSYFEMDDGRIMCQECHNHITTEREEIKQMLASAIDTLEKYYGIAIPSGIKVKFKSATAIRKASGGSGSGRVLGFYNHRRREIWVERKGPRPAVMSTLMHELTHAWQFANLEISKFDLMYLEGHTSYVEVECLRLLKQPMYGGFLEDVLTKGTDVYSEGYRFWKDYLRNETDKNIFHHIINLF